MSDFAIFDLDVARAPAASGTSRTTLVGSHLAAAFAKAGVDSGLLSRDAMGAGTPAADLSESMAAANLPLLAVNEYDGTKTYALAPLVSGTGKYGWNSEVKLGQRDAKVREIYAEWLGKVAATPCTCMALGGSVGSTGVWHGAKRKHAAVLKFSRDRTQGLVLKAYAFNAATRRPDGIETIPVEAMLGNVRVLFSLGGSLCGDRTERAWARLLQGPRPRLLLGWRTSMRDLDHIVRADGRCEWGAHPNLFADFFKRVVDIPTPNGIEAKTFFAQMDDKMARAVALAWGQSLACWTDEIASKKKRGRIAGRRRVKLNAPWLRQSDKNYHRQKTGADLVEATLTSVAAQRPLFKDARAVLHTTHGDKPKTDRLKFYYVGNPTPERIRTTTSRKLDNSGRHAPPGSGVPDDVSTTFALSAPVGAVEAGKGNKKADLQSLLGRLIELGYVWPLATDGPTTGKRQVSASAKTEQMIADATGLIRLVESIVRSAGKVSPKPANGTSAKAPASRHRDGRIDPGDDLHKWLSAANAPEWKVLTKEGTGFLNREVKDTKAYYDYGTQWLDGLIVAAGEHYAKKHQAPGGQPRPKVARIEINNASIPGGGPNPIHGTHQTGLSCDTYLPRTDGTAGATQAEEKEEKAFTYRHAEFDRAAARAQLEAFWSHEWTGRVYFSDPTLQAEGLCVELRGHDNHFHVNVFAPKAKSA